MDRPIQISIPNSNSKLKIQESSLPSDITPKKESLNVKIQDDDMNSTIPKNHPIKKFKPDPKVFSTKKRLKKLWTRQEDQLLRSLVTQNGPKQWSLISSYFEDRCGKQCRERWHNHLRIGIRKGDWTTEEQWILFLGVNTYGKKWSKISKYLIGRTENTLKNHWNCKMKPKKQKLQVKLRQIIQKKQNYLSHNPDSIEVKLIYEIIKKTKKGSLNQQNLSEKNPEQILKKMMDYYNQYLSTRKQIYAKYNLSNKQNEFNQVSIRTWNQNQSFQKKEQDNIKQTDILTQKFSMFNVGERIIDETEQQIKAKEQYFLREIQNEISKFQIVQDLQNQNQSSESDEYDESENEDQYQQSYEYDENDVNEGEQSSENMDQMQANRCRFVDYGTKFNFESPIKENLFEKIYLDESNNKK